MIYERFARWGQLGSAYNNSPSIVEKVRWLREMIGDLYENEVELNQKLDDLIKWIEEDGLTIHVSEKLDEMVSDGTIERLLNQELLGNLNEKLDSAIRQVQLLMGVDATKYPSLKDAIEYAVTNNIPRVTLGSQVFDVDQPIDVILGDSDLILEGLNATIRQVADVNVFTVSGDVISKTALSFENVTYDFSEESGGATNVTKVTLPNTNGLEVNDTVLLRGTGDYVEFTTIRLIEGNTIYLSNTTKFTYSTLIVDKLRKGTVKMKGITFDTLNASETWKSGYVYLNKLEGVSLQLDVEKGCQSALNLTNCLSYKVSKGVIKNLRNRISGQTVPNVGYGVCDIASWFGQVEGVTFINNRHGVTTEGRTYGLKVSNCTGLGCSGATFDTHALSDEVVFENCLSYGNYRGNRADGCGFQDRGLNTKFINCHVKNSFKGFVLNGTFDGTKIMNCTSDSWYDGLHAYGESGNRLVEINDSEFKVRQKSFAIRLLNVAINGSNVKGINASSVGTTAQVLELENVIGRFKSLDLTFTQFKGDNGRFISSQNSNVKIHLLTLDSGTSTLNNIAGVYGSGVLTLHEVVGAFDTDGFVGDGVYKYQLSGDSLQSGVSVIHDVGAPNTTVHFRLQYLLNPSIVYRVNTVNVDSSIGAFYKGNRLGQQILIKNVNNTNSLTVNSNATYFSNNTNVVIPPNGSLRVTWDGSNWIV